MSPETVASNLTIITGNVKSLSDVSKAILPGTEIIVSGLGISSVWEPGAWLPTMDEWTICQEGTASILSVLRERTDLKTKPLMVIISTTGISKFGRDIPLAMAPFYYYLLAAQHRDKIAMEKLVIDATEGEEKVVGEYVIVRPSMLTSGGAYPDAVRSDVEDGGVAGKAVGYTISRRDVGGYMFREVVEKYEGPGSGRGRIVAITY